MREVPLKENKITPDNQAHEEVERTHPNASRAEKYRLAQAVMLIRGYAQGATDRKRKEMKMKTRRGKVRTNEAVDVFGNYRFSLTSIQQSKIQGWLRTHEERDSAAWQLLHAMTYADSWTKTAEYENVVDAHGLENRGWLYFTEEEEERRRVLNEWLREKEKGAA